MNTAHEELERIARAGADHFGVTSLASGHAGVTRRVRRHRTARAAATTVAGIGVIGGATWGGMEAFSRGMSLAPAATPTPGATEAVSTLDVSALGPCDDALEHLGDPAAAVFPEGEVPNDVLCMIKNGDGVALMLSPDAGPASPLILRADAAMALAAATDAFGNTGLDVPCFWSAYMPSTDERRLQEAGGTASAEAASAHGAGLAFDICAGDEANFDAIATVLAGYGWTAPDPAAPWHFEYSPSGEASSLGRITLPDGKTVDEIAGKIAEVYGLTPEEVAAALAASVHELIPEASTAEGWPMTGIIDLTSAGNLRDATDLVIKARVQELTDLGVPRADWQTVITKASLVEREAKLDVDRPKIARVIDNRLAQDMKLQLDSTIRYAIDSTGAFNQEDPLVTGSPYNTDLYQGLPPGAIATPSDASIRAVLNPAEGDWLFFVTVNLDTGEMAYATTFEDHQKNVQKLQAWIAAQPKTTG